MRHPSSWNVALNATRTVVNSQGPFCNSSKTVWQSFNCFILERGYYNRWRGPSFYHRAQSSGNGLQKASTSRTDPLQNILLTFLPFVMKYLEISKPNYREGEGGSIRASISFFTTMRKCQLAVRPRIWVTIKKKYIWTRRKLGNCGNRNNFIYYSSSVERLCYCYCSQFTTLFFCSCFVIVFYFLFFVTSLSN